MIDTLQVSLAALKAEADSILKEWPELTIEEAYGMAHSRLAAFQAEKYAMSPFEAQLLTTIERLSENGRPVRTTSLSAELNGADTWKLWYHLRKLRRRGLVSNHGKSGWVIAA